MSTRYVRSKYSEAAVKFRLLKDAPCNSPEATNLDWSVVDSLGRNMYLPKTEYVECAPPTRWVDAMGEFTLFDANRSLQHCAVIFSTLPADYRWVWQVDVTTQQAALRIEKREEGT